MIPDEGDYNEGTEESQKSGSVFSAARRIGAQLIIPHPHDPMRASISVSEVPEETVELVPRMFQLTHHSPQELRGNSWRMQSILRAGIEIRDQLQI